MFTLDSRGFEDLAKSLIGMEKHFPSVVARTLTLVAQDAKHQVYGWLPKMLDRPTPWTKRSLFVFPAEKSEPVIRAAVVFKHEEGRLPRSAMGRVEASTSMWVQAHGVPRPLKASEKTLRANGITRDKQYLVPAKGAKLDKYGNVTGSFMNRVLYSGVGRGVASFGYHQPMSRTATDKRSKKSPYFVLSNDNGPIGIYQNMGKGKPPMPVFIFVNRVEYRVRVPFDKIARAEVNRVMGKRLRESWDVVFAKYRFR